MVVLPEFPAIGVAHARQVAELIENGVPEEAEQKMGEEHGASFSERLADLFVKGKLAFAFIFNEEKGWRTIP